MKYTAVYGAQNIKIYKYFGRVSFYLKMFSELKKVHMY